MRWTKIALASLLVLGFALGACSDRAETPTSPVAQDDGADKRPPQPPPGTDLYALWRSNICSEFESVQGPDWYQLEISLSEYDATTETCKVHHDSWPPGANVFIKVEKGDPTLIEDIILEMPSGTSPFFSNATIYKLEVPAGVHVAVYMPPDPLRYSPAIFDDEFAHFEILDNEPWNIIKYPTALNTALPKLFDHEVGGSGPSPDNGRVIVPPETIPPSSLSPAAIYALWEANVAAAYKSLYSWYQVPIDSSEYEEGTGICSARHDDWPSGVKMAIEVVEGDYHLLDSLVVEFPGGTTPFLSSATFYRVRGCEGLTVVVHMPPDPMRYTSWTFGNEFARYAVLDSGFVGSGQLFPTAMIPDLPLFDDEVGSIASLPDPGGVILPPELVPPEDGDD